MTCFLSSWAQRISRPRSTVVVGIGYVTEMPKKEPALVVNKTIARILSEAGMMVMLANRIVP